MIAPKGDRFDDSQFAGRQLKRPSRTLMWVFALAVLLPSLYGFGTKFLEFIALFRGDVDGAFAITPILNYLLASLGFLLLFGWAALGGMFKNVEQPKYSMLENEAWLDSVESSDWRRHPDQRNLAARHVSAERFRLHWPQEDSP